MDNSVLLIKFLEFTLFLILYTFLTSEKKKKSTKGAGHGIFTPVIPGFGW